LIEPMRSKDVHEKQPNDARRGLTVVLDLTGGRAFIIERPETEIVPALVEIARGDVERSDDR
jgi:hypothetical protein